MGNTVLQEKQLLGVLLLKTSKSRNKMLRFRWSYEGERFRIIDYGHFIYHLVPTTEDDYDIMVRRNTYPDFLYIPVLHKIAYEGYVSIFRDGDGYTVQPATETEISKHARRFMCMPGTLRISSGSFVAIEKEDFLFLRSKPYIHMHVVQNGSKFYIESWPCDEEEAKDLPFLTQICGQVKKYDEFEYVLRSSSLHQNHKLPISSTFVKKCGGHHGDRFHVWRRNDNVLVTEAQPISCGICGRMINRYHENSVEKYVCQGCYKDLEDARKLALEYTGKEDLMRVKEVLSSVRKMMENILEEK